MSSGRQRFDYCIGSRDSRAARSADLAVLVGPSLQFFPWSVSGPVRVSWKFLGPRPVRSADLKIFHFTCPPSPLFQKFRWSASHFSVLGSLIGFLNISVPGLAWVILSHTKYPLTPIREFWTKNPISENWASVISGQKIQTIFQTYLDFLFKNDPSSIPRISGVISPITWYLPTVTSRGFTVVYSKCYWRIIMKQIKSFRNEYDVIKTKNRTGVLSRNDASWHSRNPPDRG